MDKILVPNEPSEVTEIRNKILTEFKDLTFIEEGHKYFLSGIQLPSVSEVTHQFCAYPFDEQAQAIAYAEKHVPNLSMPITEYYVDFTTTTCSIYKANHQLVTPPSICYEGDYVTTYETHMESLDAFYDKGTFNILTSFK